MSTTQGNPEIAKFTPQFVQEAGERSSENFRDIGKVSAGTIRALCRGTKGSAKKPVKPVSADQIEDEFYGWAYDKHIPIGATGYVHGDGEAGKTSVLLWFAAQISNGNAPGQWFGEKKHVAIISPEDPPAFVKNKFIQMGGDPSYLSIWDLVPTEDNSREKLNLYEKPHVEAVVQWLQEEDYGLVIIDDHVAALNIKKDGDRASINAAFTPLNALAKELHIGIQAIGHHNKQISIVSSSERAAGSRGYQNYNRIMHAVIKDPDEPDATYLCVDKCNIIPTHRIGAMKFGFHEGEYKTTAGPMQQFGYVQLEEELSDSGLVVAARLLSRHKEISTGASKSRAVKKLTCVEILQDVMYDAHLNNERLTVEEMTKRVDAVHEYTADSHKNARRKLGLASDNKKPATYWLEGEALEVVRQAVAARQETLDSTAPVGRGLLDLG